MTSGLAALIPAAGSRSPALCQVWARTSTVDRGKQGTKRSVVTDATRLRLHLAADAANAHDTPLIEPTLAGIPDAVGPLPDGACVHLDTGYDSGKTRELLEVLGYDHRIATKGKLSPIQVGRRWVVERTHSWINGFGKLRLSTYRRHSVVKLYAFLGAAITANAYCRTVLKVVESTECEMQRLLGIEGDRRVEIGSYDAEN